VRFFLTTERIIIYNFTRQRLARVKNRNARTPTARERIIVLFSRPAGTFSHARRRLAVKKTMLKTANKRKKTRRLHIMRRALKEVCRTKTKNARVFKEKGRL
jgi:hypothetical protein